MKTNSCTAFWAALLSSTVWAASANPHSTAMAMVWGAFAVLILAVDTAAAWEEKKRSNVQDNRPEAVLSPKGPSSSRG